MEYGDRKAQLQVYVKIDILAEFEAIAEEKKIKLNDAFEEAILKWMNENQVDWDDICIIG